MVSEAYLNGTAVCLNCCYAEPDDKILRIELHDTDNPEQDRRRRLTEPAKEGTAFRMNKKLYPGFAKPAARPDGANKEKREGPNRTDSGIVIWNVFEQQHDGRMKYIEHAVATRSLSRGRCPKDSAVPLMHGRWPPRKHSRGPRNEWQVRFQAHGAYVGATLGLARSDSRNSWAEKHDMPVACRKR